MEYKYWFVHNPVSGNFPKVKHDTFSAASSEAQRLATNNPGTVFFVLEAVAAYVTEAPKVVKLSLEHCPVEAIGDYSE